MNEDKLSLKLNVSKDFGFGGKMIFIKLFDIVAFIDAVIMIKVHFQIYSIDVVEGDQFSGVVGS